MKPQQMHPATSKEVIIRAVWAVHDYSPIELSGTRDFPFVARSHMPSIAYLDRVPICPWCLHAFPVSDAPSLAARQKPVCRVVPASSIATTYQDPGCSKRSQSSATPRLNSMPMTHRLLAEELLPRHSSTHLRLEEEADGVATYMLRAEKWQDTYSTTILTLSTRNNGAMLSLTSRRQLSQDPCMIFPLQFKCQAVSI